MFNIKEEELDHHGIPPQIDSARFDIAAKLVNPDPEALKGMTQEQHRMLLLPLLSERFQVLDHPFFGSLPEGRECRSIQTMATDGVSLF